MNLLGKMNPEIFAKKKSVNPRFFFLSYSPPRNKALLRDNGG